MRVYFIVYKVEFIGLLNLNFVKLNNMDFRE